MKQRPYPAGLIDPHVHTAPDVVPRSLDDLEMVRAADEAGFGAVVLKSHHTVTAARATIAEQCTESTRVLGGVVLNLHATGGINPLAVEAALQLGARMIWLPTITAANHLAATRYGGVTNPSLQALGTVEGGGVAVVDDQGRPREDVCRVLDLVAAAGATLATGHIGAAEIMAVVPEAVDRGVANILVTHPEHRVVGLTVAQQLELAQLPGVWFERVFVLTLPSSEGLPVQRIVENLRAVGPSSTVLASDLGQRGNPLPVAGMHTYIDALREQGVTDDDIELMACVNPANALRLDVA